MNAELRLYSLIALGGVGLLLAAAAWSRSRRKTPDQKERERRMRISEMGRITDGTVIDVNEMQTNGSGELQLLIYHYDVAGVSYEASQDVSSLRHMVDLHSCRVRIDDLNQVRSQQSRQFHCDLRKLDWAAPLERSGKPCQKPDLLRRLRLLRTTISIDHRYSITSPPGLPQCGQNLRAIRTSG